MRGRRPSGPDYVDRCNGEEIAKERFKVILETIAGTCRVLEACVRLRVCEQRFHQLREDAFDGALAGLRPRPRGRRPRRLSSAEEEIKVLRERIAALELELRTARAREEIALVLPNARHGSDQEQQEKKTRGRPRKSLLRKDPFRNTPVRPPGRRKNT